MKSIIQLKLKILARLILRKYKPVVVGITGSVGKTSAKEAIAAVLSSKFRVGGGMKNYNNEIGLPLVIIGAETAGRNIFGWIRVFFKAFFMAMVRDRNYPEVLVLEMGIDRPGDMSYLTGIATPNIGIVTAIGNVHLENFGSKAKLVKEKTDLVRAVPKEGWVILNADDDIARKMTDSSKARVLTYGLGEKVDVGALEINYSFQGSDILDGLEKDISALAGISFKLKHEGSAVPVLLPGVLSRNSVYAALAAASTGLTLGMNLHEISKALSSIKSPKGRMNLIPGANNALIIDDTYNAEPKSAISGLEALADFKVRPGAKKYALLADMLELGDVSEEEHRRVGVKAKESGPDCLIAVGKRANAIANGAIAAGFPESSVYRFDNSLEAGKFVREKLAAGDLAYVKGSQGMRMEKAVKAMMAKPEKAGELLVRQDWET